MSGRPQRSTDARRRWLALLVAAVAVLPYVNSLTNDFTVDDILVIRDHPMISGGGSSWELLTWVGNVTGTWYRPLTMLSYAANQRVSAGPFGFHVVNLALHVLATLGVFRLATLLIGSTVGGAITAVYFAVHPIHTEAVSSIVGRAELLAAALVIAALLALVRAARARGFERAAWMMVSAVAFGAASFAKESALAAVPLFAATDAWLASRWRWGRALGLLMLYAAIGGVYVAVRFSVAGAVTLPELPQFVVNPLAYADAFTRVRTAIIIAWQYLALLLVPMRLSIDYSFNEIPLALSWEDPRFLLAAAILAAVAVALAYGARRVPVLVMAALFAVVPLALTANFLFPIGTIKAERLLYLPSVGWCLAIGALAALAIRTRPAAWTTVLAGLLVALAARSWTRNLDWKDNRTLYLAALAASPDSATAHYNAATVFSDEGRLDDAELHFRRALAIYPQCFSAAFGIGIIRQRQGRDGEAMYWYQRALDIEWRLPKAHLQVAMLRERRGEYDAAEAALRTGLEMAPEDPMLVVHLSAVQLAQGDRWRALNTLSYLDGLSSSDPEAMQLAQQARREMEVAIR